MAEWTIQRRMQIHEERNKGFRHDDLNGEVPAIQFPAHWLVRMISPFGGTRVRFVVTDAENAGEWISVYYDDMWTLGYFGWNPRGGDEQVPEPYWEMYPNLAKDPERFAANDVNGLIAAINAVFIQKRRDAEGCGAVFAAIDFQT